MMRNNFFVTLFPFFLLVLSLAVLGCEKDYVATTVPSRAFSEDFDTVANLYHKGWIFTNNSKPQGVASWGQGMYTTGLFGITGFPAYSYKASADEYAYVYYDAVNDVGTISSWMITPELQMQNGDKFSFYTRTYPGNISYADRLQVRLNPANGSADVGYDANSIGDFTTLITAINSTLSSAGYPQTWTKYEFTISGLQGTASKRRIAFRYFVPDGGANGTNSLAIGIDKFEYSPQ